MFIKYVVLGKKLKRSFSVSLVIGVASGFSTGRELFDNLFSQVYSFFIYGIDVNYYL